MGVTLREVIGYLDKTLEIDRFKDSGTTPLPVEGPRGPGDGDIVEPTLFGERLGLRFRFHRLAVPAVS